MRRGPGKRRLNGRDIAAQLQRQDRRAKALSLYVDGLTLRVIGKQLGVSHAQVDRDIKLAIEERNARTREEARAVAIERVGAIISANMPAARKPRYSQAKRDSGKLVLEAVALGAKLLGLEAPKRLELTGDAGGPVQIGRPVIMIPPERSNGVSEQHTNGVPHDAPAAPGRLDPESGASN